MINGDGENEITSLMMILYRSTKVLLSTKIWNIAGKVVFVVTDNADNVVNAVKDVMGWKHMGCFAHSLNLVVTRAVNKNHDVVTLIETVKRIVSHFKRSTQSTEKLIEYQVRNNEPNNKPKKLIQDVSTRWNSTYFMLKRFVLLQEPIKATLALIDKDLPVLTPVQWKMLCELILVLKPFYTVTKTVSGEKYATGSLVIPLTNSLFTVCGKLKERNFSPQVKEVVTELNKEMSKRFGNFESSNTLTLLTFIDPRFKNLVFKDPAASSNAKDRVINAIGREIIRATEEQERAKKNAKERPADVAITEHEEQEIVTENQSRQEVDELSVFNSLEMCLAKKKKKGSVKSRAIVELDRFLEEDELEWKGDPLLWWKENGPQYPYLRKVVQKNFCCLATSVPCERAFSRAGLFVSDRRNRLSGTKTKMLMFLNANQPNNRQPAFRKGNEDEDRLESEEDKILKEIISKNLEAT